MCLTSKSAQKEEMVGQTKVVYAGYEIDENISACLEVAKDSLSYFNSAFGKYPYSTLTVVKTPFLFGGMEYPGIVFIADSIKDETEFKKVIVHEIAHQWWYGVVGNNEITTAWFDESMAEYSTVLFFEHYPEYAITKDEMVGDAIQDYMLYIDVVDSVNLKANRSMQLALNEYSSEYEYVYMVYVKGVVFINELRKAIGDEIFFKSVKNLYKDNMFQIMTKEKFIKAFADGSGVDIEHFVEGWLNGQTNIE
jgi:aminopeptidase N